MKRRFCAKNGELVKLKQKCLPNKNCKHLFFMKKFEKISLYAANDTSMEPKVNSLLQCFAVFGRKFICKQD